ncbi:hypothetical protein E2C01_099873 [Portunus trituberculatus]|uniref:Uncharacterized protein n=1 Tax=Portunus trituberculatus TaxID=210409 RepID=A0A5B7KGG8_PORTR|nr:hypothetical protein [Portunus trituberculatus]
MLLTTQVVLPARTNLLSALVPLAAPLDLLSLLREPLVTQLRVGLRWLKKTQNKSCHSFCSYYYICK